jgi:peptide/nickel transport system permease protein
MAVPSLEQTEGIEQLAAAPTGDFEVDREVGYYQLVWRRLRRHRPAMISAVVLAVIALSCFIIPGFQAGPVTWNGFLPSDWNNPNLLHRFDGPTWPHIMGTDELGRDIFLRVLKGGQISILVGLGAAFVTVVVGVTFGAISGYFGGLIDNALMRVTDAMLTVPSIFILILLSSGIKIGPVLVPGQTPPLIIVAIGLVAWPYTARIIRSVVLSVREKEYVEAARAIGSGTRKILIRHILPNALGPIVVSATLYVGVAIITESALSYLGLGIGPPIASWGSMLFHAQEFIWEAAHYALFPGAMILVTVLCVNFIGDGLRDAFDPRSFER